MKNRRVKKYLVFWDHEIDWAPYECPRIKWNHDFIPRIKESIMLPDEVDDFIYSKITEHVDGFEEEVMGDHIIFNKCGEPFNHLIVLDVDYRFNKSKEYNNEIHIYVAPCDYFHHYADDPFSIYPREYK